MALTLVANQTKIRQFSLLNFQEGEAKLIMNINALKVAKAYFRYKFHNLMKRTPLVEL